MRLRNSSWYLIIFFASVALFAWLESSYTFIDPDSFYHARFSQLMSKQGIITNFSWQQATVLKNYFTDHHLLYHLLLVPLNYFFNPAIAIKIGSVLLNSFFIVLFAWYLQKKKIKYYGIYVALLMTAVPFLIRLSAPKASPLALILLLLGIYCSEQKKYLFLILISFLYVWSHGGFILLLIIGIIFSWKSLWPIIAGFAAGLIINPYFPKNILFYWQQVVQIGIVNYQGDFEVGAEWYHYSLPNLMGNTHLVWIPLVLALVVFIAYFKQQSRNNRQWSAIFILFFLATLRSRRFVEYFVPATIIWSALVMNWYVQSVHFKKMYHSFLLSWQKRKFWWSLLIIYMLIVIPFGAIRGLWLVKQEQEHGIAISSFQSASEYLSAHSAPHSIVFNGQWDEWPILFYHNINNDYLVGLDPTFMYKYDTRLFNLWQEIRSGKINSNIAQVINDNFHCRYIFINNENEGTKLFHAYMMRDTNIKQIYSDKGASIYEIIL